jgi:hypothetical protein
LPTFFCTVLLVAAADTLEAIFSCTANGRHVAGTRSERGGVAP